MKLRWNFEENDTYRRYLLKDWKKLHHASASYTRAADYLDKSTFSVVWLLNLFYYLFL